MLTEIDLQLDSPKKLTCLMHFNQNLYIIWHLCSCQFLEAYLTCSCTRFAGMGMVFSLFLVSTHIGLTLFLTWHCPHPLRGVDEPIATPLSWGPSHPSVQHPL